jgi:transcription elongation GreA/GreB family factor
MDRRAQVEAKSTRRRKAAVSRAFVKETDGDTTGLPDRPISPHRNLVTEAGLAAIDDALARFETAHRTAVGKGDPAAAALASREVRYWRARRATAEVVNPPDDRTAASFGTTVTLRRDDGREQTFKIVGEDEADPSRGTVSYVSPLARAVLTHGVGDAVVIANSEAVILDVR